MTSILLGIASSFATELVTWIDKKLSGTAFKGNGAFILAGAVAFVFAFFQAFQNGSFSLANLGVSFSQVFATANIWFVIVYQNLGLDVSSTPAVPAAPAAPSTPAQQ